MTQAPAPANLILGTETFLAERRRSAIVAAARAHADAPDVPVEMHKATDITAPELAELLSPSLFSEDRIIVVTGVEDAAQDTVKLLEQAIADPADGVVLVMIHTGKGRNKKLVNTWPKMGVQVHSAGELKGRDRHAFVEQEFRSHGVRVSPDVVSLVLDSVGSGLRELASAISQLAADTGGNVTADSVRKYYQGRAEVTGFEVADLAVTGRLYEAVVAARRALQLGVPHVLLAAAMCGAVADIARVAGARRIDPRRDAADYGMAPWKLEKTMRHARMWSPEAISEGLQVVAHLDADVKGRSQSADYAVEHAVRRIASLAAGQG
ncbi:DNA polymerase III subunit delta [Corynebacterium heidelbergense]|uniref:DNA polymerase III subunit delta n=1 Tax=Corynebacterium heidelbergense TaxID=2055947 RepID=A0A364VAP8_9CORY|nr:DNA polymerase III subunit delta [Corynebacterium heidelbergense]RAV33697.1 DNA polymerase III subunit delta [Corynebacterium heidelbergense]WCZ36227.1 hypothetical protein CHEID_03360 [Corynebacterium heidelbergense]